MYITYDTKQYPIFADGDIALYGDRKTSKLQALEQSNERPPPGIRHLMTLSPSNDKKKKNPFRPPRLVRISDMTIVPGTEANKEGYCALSYAWNWSGDIVVRAKDNSIRVDKAKHKLIFHHPYNSQIPIAATAVTAKTEAEKKHQLQQVYDKTKHDEQENEDIVSFVKFEDAIQQICKDFNIQYIWYDYLCINKKKPKAEQDIEMRQMHQYYSNAQYTVVLVPEMKIARKVPLSTTVATQSTYYPIGHHNISRCISAILESQWSMRAWTYQEAISSQRLLFVGENTHLWSDSMRHIYYSQFAVASDVTRIAAYYVKSLCKKPQQQNHITSLPSTTTTTTTTTASTVLRHFHTRRSTKEHDRLFALSNIFHNIDDLHITSKKSVLTQMVDLYSKIANHDLTILCFGKPTKAYPSTMRQYCSQLPSWTGVSGEHVYAKSNNTNVSVTTLNHGTKKTQKSLWPPSNNNKEKSTTNNDVVIRIQKLVRKVVITLAIANNKIKTAPNTNKNKYTSNIDNDDNNTYLLATAKSSYLVHDGIMYMYCKYIPVSVEPFDWDDCFKSFSMNQIFSYKTTLLSTESSRPETTNLKATKNDFKNNNNFLSCTKLWMDPRDLTVLEEATGLQITHTLLLNSLVPATDVANKDTMISSICFSLTTSDCSECVILCGISFDVQHCNRKFKAYPVIKKTNDNDNYQSIGLCFVRSAYKTFSNYSRIQRQRFTIK
ncbi:hypothetical protein BDC45DRAFT_525119 [Circinella umbellata]|nr:hypothetical protein BDC45DRAFT_525119 [Circinella umbellata]